MNLWHDKAELWGHRLTFTSLLVLAAGVFTSVTFSALAHLLLFLPSIYFFFRDFSKYPPSKSWWSLTAVVLVIWISVLFNWQEVEEPGEKNFKKQIFFIGLDGSVCLSISL